GTSGTGEARLELLAIPGVQTLARKAGGHVHLPVKLWRNSCHELAREGLVGFLATRCTEGKIVVYGLLECLLEFSNALTLDGNDIARIDDFAVKDAGFVVELDFSNVSLVLHHGVTPASVRNRRIERTAPLSVSFWGCGP